MAVVMLVGASGLVGQHVLALARADGRVSHVVAPTRRPLPPGPKLQNPLVDFAALPAKAPWWQVDALICTLGTTLRQAGSRDAFRQVDFDFVLACARLARRHGAHTFALNSTLGADPNSRNFYLRVKGEVERASTGCGFSSLTFVRPAMITGERALHRPLESLAIFWMQSLAPLMPRRFRPVAATSVAHALLEAALAAEPGVQAVESDGLR
jgi:uncharacterized protein YbjT (DUF2867 family)